MTQETATSPPTTLSPQLMAELRTVLQEVLAQVAPPADPELRLYTPEEAAALLGVRKNWVADRIRSGEIRCTYVGRFPRLTAEHIREIHRAGEVDPATRGRKKRRS